MGLELIINNKTNEIKTNNHVTLQHNYHNKLKYLSKLNHNLERTMHIYFLNFLSTTELRFDYHDRHTLYFD